jgi:hypothetical protein
MCFVATKSVVAERLHHPSTRQILLCAIILAKASEQVACYVLQPAKLVSLRGARERR